MAGQQRRYAHAQDLILVRYVILEAPGQCLANEVGISESVSERFGVTHDADGKCTSGGE